jgi:hypothetical protein
MNVKWLAIATLIFIAVAFLYLWYGFIYQKLKNYGGDLGLLFADASLILVPVMIILLIFQIKKRI